MNDVNLENIPAGLPVEPEQKRGGCLTAFLIAMLIVNSLAAALYFFLHARILASYPRAPGFLMYLLGFMCLANVGFAAAVWYWKKWGVYGFAAMSVVAFAINLYLGIGLIQLLLGLAGIVILIVLVRPIWSRFD